MAWLLWLHRALLFGTILAGSAAASDLLEGRGKILALAAAACATLDLVGDFTTGSVTHRDIARDYLAMVADLRRSGFSEEARARADAELFRISALEPAPYNAARDLAYNQAIISLDRDKSDWVEVPWYRRLFAHVWRFEGTKPHTELD